MDNWGAWAAIFAALTFAGFVWQEVRRWRTRPFPKLRASAPTIVGTFLNNDGEVAARNIIVMLGREPGPEPSVRLGVISAINPGEYEVIRRSDLGDEDGWLILMYDHPHRKNRQIWTWTPLHQDSDVAAVEFEQTSQTWVKRLRMPRALRKAVGPHGVHSRVIRSDPKSLRRLSKKTAKALEKQGLEPPLGRQLRDLESQANSWRRRQRGDE